MYVKDQELSDCSPLLAAYPDACSLVGWDLDLIRCFLPWVQLGLFTLKLISAASFSNPTSASTGLGPCLSSQYKLSPLLSLLSSASVSLTYIRSVTHV